jgi:hypothetical protein
VRKITLLIMFVSTISLTAFGQTLNRCDYKDNKKDKRIEEEFKRLHAYEAEIIMRGDAAALDSFYPEDHIVTNPFNQLIDKKNGFGACPGKHHQVQILRKEDGIFMRLRRHGYHCGN